ncbi:MAG: hypothetical protein IJN75_06245 [Clostridia bacterium]|nr:hypothetical protein [Clostridia bacterium]
MKKFNIHEVEKKLNYHFNNPDLLEQAFTRSSYASENNTYDNEVLEFIGDSILGIVVVKRLIAHYTIDTPKIPTDLKKLYSIKSAFSCELDEAELSDLKISIVQRSTLAAATENLGLENYLLMGKSDILGEVQNQPSVKEDLFEAIVGALAIDCNWNMTILEKVVSDMLDIDGILEKGSKDEEDWEKSLENWFSENNDTLNFEFVSSINENLKCGVNVNLGFNMLNYVAYGYGLTEKGAKRMAAKRAMKVINKINNRKEVIIKSVGEPDQNRAINQLQELYQKKIISEPKYSFEKHTSSQCGNPQWKCICTIDGLITPSGGYICDSKNEAKKLIAYEILKYLIGNDLKTKFLENGQIVDNN